MAMKLMSERRLSTRSSMRGDERYAVQDASGKPVNGEEKGQDSGRRGPG